ncbi:hypothetical protein GCM10018953_62950 [Streptosporangium nondiastaticum]
MRVWGLGALAGSRRLGLLLVEGEAGSGAGHEVWKRQANGTAATARASSARPAAPASRAPACRRARA